MMTDQTARIAAVAAETVRRWPVVCRFIRGLNPNPRCTDAQKTIDAWCDACFHMEARDLLLAQQAECATLRNQLAEERRAREVGVDEIWEDVLRCVQRAWSEPRSYADCPTELIAELVDERDGLRGALETRTRQRDTAEAEFFGLRADLLEADNEGDVLEARVEAAEAALSTLQTQLRHALHYIRCDSDCAGPWPHRPEHCACGAKAIRADIKAALLPAPEDVSEPAEMVHPIQTKLTILLRAEAAEAALSTLQAQVRALAVTWDAAADFEHANSNGQYASALVQCADDLNAALLPAPEGETSG